MKLLIAFIIIVAIKASISLPAKEQHRVRYDNYAVYIINIQNIRQRQVLLKLLEQPKHYNLWHMTVTEVHLMVSPLAMRAFHKLMAKEKIVAKFCIANVQELIDAQSNK